MKTEKHLKLVEPVAEEPFDRIILEQFVAPMDDALRRLEAIVERISEEEQ